MRSSESSNRRSLLRHQQPPSVAVAFVAPIEGLLDRPFSTVSVLNCLEACSWLHQNRCLLFLLVLTAQSTWDPLSLLLQSSAFDSQSFYPAVFHSVNSAAFLLLPRRDLNLALAFASQQHTRFYRHRTCTSCQWCFLGWCTTQGVRHATSTRHLGGDHLHC